MTREELENLRVEITNKAQKEYDSVCREFLDKNYSYKVGDTIEDHIGKGVIKELMIRRVDFRHTSSPSIMFNCDNLTKKGTINKKEPIRNIYSINIK